MRPDRIVVGEVRDGAALDMLQAMNTGHDGSLTTVHANTPRDALARLETMVLMAGMDLPVRAIREQVASAVDLIIQVSRASRTAAAGSPTSPRWSAWRATSSPCRTSSSSTSRPGMDADGRYRGALDPTGLRPRFLEELAAHGVTVPLEVFTVAGGSGDDRGREPGCALALVAIASLSCSWPARAGRAPSRQPSAERHRRAGHAPARCEFFLAARGPAAGQRR